MRKMLSLAVVAIAVIAAASCSSGSSNKAASSSSSSTPTGSSSSSVGGTKTSLGDAEFCQRLSGAFDAISAQSDLSGASETFQAFKNVDPPAALSGVWDDFIQALNEISQLNQNDQAGFGQVAVRHSRSIGQVSAYISSSCAAFGQSQLSSLSSLSS